MARKEVTPQLRLPPPWDLGRRDRQGWAAPRTKGPHPPSPWPDPAVLQHPRGEGNAVPPTRCSTGRAAPRPDGAEHRSWRSGVTEQGLPPPSSPSHPSLGSPRSALSPGPRPPISAGGCGVAAGAARWCRPCPPPRRWRWGHGWHCSLTLYLPGPRQPRAQNSSAALQIAWSGSVAPLRPRYRQAGWECGPIDPRLGTGHSGGERMWAADEPFPTDMKPWGQGRPCPAVPGPLGMVGAGGAGSPSRC